MYEERVDTAEKQRELDRLRAFSETETWKRHVKPFLVSKLIAAKTGIMHHEDGPTHWKSVGIYAHIEDFLVYIENVPLEKALWQKEKENQEKKQKQKRPNWWKKLVLKKSRKENGT